MILSVVGCREYIPCLIVASNTNETCKYKMKSTWRNLPTTDLLRTSKFLKGSRKTNKD